jgi:NAD+ kinase
MERVGRISKVGIVAAMHKRDIEPALRKVFSALEAWGVEVLLQSECAMLLGKMKHSASDAEIATSDMIFSLGGDGCMLNAVRMAVEYGTPVLGVRVGGLGFLSEVDWQDIDEAVEAIRNNKYLIDRRKLLQATVERGGNIVWLSYGLNDVVVLRGALSQVHMFEVRVDGELLIAEFADGIIVATPTGSTAYSLSAGGPIIAPDADVLVLTPVCAHALYVRSIVVPPSSRFSIKAIATKGTEVEAAVMVDGQLTFRLSEGDVAHVRFSERTANLVRLSEFRFIERLKRKLKWGHRDETVTER